MYLLAGTNIDDKSTLLSGECWLPTDRADAIIADALEHSKSSHAPCKNSRDEVTSQFDTSLFILFKAQHHSCLFELEKEV